MTSEERLVTDLDALVLLHGSDGGTGAYVSGSVARRLLRSLGSTGA